MTLPRANPLLLGQDQAEAALLDALNGARMHHAWLLAGPEGVGKATLAFRLARRLLAGPPPGGRWTTLELDPSHPAFRRVAAGTHADLLTVEREWDEKRRRVRRQIAAEDARRIPPFLRLTPAEGGWRVVVVDGAEDLNAHSANALLKILEEPPPRALLLLCCAAPGRLLPTLRSRVRTLRLDRLGAADMDRLLPALLPETPPAERDALSRLARGSPGRAVALAAEDGVAAAALAAEVLAALPRLRPSRMHAVADRLARAEGGTEAFLELLRDALSEAARAHARGVADPAQLRLAAAVSGAVPGRTGQGPLAALDHLWESLGRLQRETEGLSLDRRQAVVQALSLLAAPAGRSPGATPTPGAGRT